jgi:hypothetical protein
MPTKAADTGLMIRGLVVLGFLTVLACVVLFVALGRPTQELPSQRLHSEWLTPLAAAPQAGFPAGLAWSGMSELGQALPSARGFEIRYNATIALARRGSPTLPFDVLREMLDEDRQMLNFRATLADGREVPDEGAARRTVLGALKALAEWQHHPDVVKAVGASDPGLLQVQQAVERLTHSSNLVVRTEAEKTRQTFPH